MSQLNLSARVYHSNLKLGRTIADLTGSEGIHSVHLVEGRYALQQSRAGVRPSADPGSRLG